MAIWQKRYSSFGREDRASGVRALVKGDSFFIRIIAYVVLAGLFFLVVQLTHRTPPPEANETSAPTTTKPASK